MKYISYVLCILLAMATYFLYQAYLIQLDNVDIYIEAYNVSLERQARLKAEKLDAQRIILDMEKNEKNLISKIDLITSFGITDRISIENIRDVLELAEKVPYGSPFASGHWVSSAYGLRDERQINGNNYTEGIDLVGKGRDRTVRTTADGTIIDFGYSDTYGKYIVVDHLNGFRTQYSHLNKIFYQSDKGDVLGIPIVKGDRIGIMGNTGLCFSENGGDGSHLDYRIFMYDKVEDVWVTLNPTQCLRYSGGDTK